MNENPTAPEPRIRLLDLAEYALVVSVDLAGNMQMSSRTPCPAERAAMLRDLADLIDNTSHACCGAHPVEGALSADAGKHPAEVAAAFLVAEAARDEQPGGHPLVDDEPVAPVWRDRAGHLWDLALGWRDAGGVDWWWTGAYDMQCGAPLMQSECSPFTQPLDALAASWGPLSPSRGRSC